MDKVIEVRNLEKSYKISGGKSLKAVNNISFFVEKGEIFAILGPNGAGKTTTLEIIESLKKQTSGTIAVLDLDNIKQADEIKKRIGVQLQSADYLPYLSLKELLNLFASIYGQKANIGELLSLVDLQEKANEPVKNLSGGQKQRFTIASSLVNKPEVLFMDEPTTGLDPAARRQLWGLIKKINASGVTIVLTTHYMEEAEFLCNRVAIMDQGKILKIDSPQNLIGQLSDTVQISFFPTKDIKEETLKQLSGVKKIYSREPKVIMEIESLEKVAEIVKQLKQQQISFTGFTVKTASLEDVYLQLTGKEYQE